MPFLLLMAVSTRVNAREGEEEMVALKSVEEAAGLLGISKWTVRAYIRSGRLRPVRLGRRVLLSEAELERFVAGGQRTETEPVLGTPIQESVGKKSTNQNLRETDGDNHV